MNYRIGQLAKAASVNIETIRYYERQGLIEQPPKPANGLRLYPQITLTRIRFIKRAQELGFTLKEIEHLMALNTAPCGQVQKLAEDKLSSVQGKIADLERLAHVLKALLAQCRINPDEAHCPIIDTLQPPEQ